MSFEEFINMDQVSDEVLDEILDEVLENNKMQDEAENHKMQDEAETPAAPVNQALEESLKTQAHDFTMTFQLRRIPPPAWGPQQGILPGSQHLAPVMYEKRWAFEVTPSLDRRAYLATRTDFLLSQRCILCHKDSRDEFKCEVVGCVSGLYCSENCRDLDRLTHVFLCTPLMNEFAVRNRPSDLHFRAFAFIPDERQPRPMWIRCEFDKNTGLVKFMFDQECILRWNSERAGRELKGWINPCGGQHTVYTIGQGHGVLLFGMKPVAGNKPEDINLGVAALATPGHLIPEFGPVFVLRHYVSGLEMAFHSFGDSSLRDLQHGIDNIIASACHATVSDVTRHRYRHIPGLKISDLDCPWNQAMGICDEIAEVRARLVNVAMPNFIPLYLRRIGLFWLMRPTAVPEGAEIKHWFSKASHIWRWILIDIDKATEEERADVRLRVRGGIVRKLPALGSFVVTDAYGRKINKHHIGAVTAYFADHQLKGKDDDFMLPDVSKEEFQEFWNIYKIPFDEATFDIIESPYDIEHDDANLRLPHTQALHVVDVEQLVELEKRRP